LLDTNKTIDHVYKNGFICCLALYYTDSTQKPVNSECGVRYNEKRKKTRVKKE